MMWMMKNYKMKKRQYMYLHHHMHIDWLHYIAQSNTAQHSEWKMKNRKKKKKNLKYIYVFMFVMWQTQNIDLWIYISVPSIWYTMWNKYDDGSTPATPAHLSIYFTQLQQPTYYVPLSMPVCLHQFETTSAAYPIWGQTISARFVLPVHHKPESRKYNLYLVQRTYGRTEVYI